MLQSPVKIATVRLQLAAHFLRHLGSSPWRVVAGGQQRSFTAATLEAMGKWVAAAQAQQHSVYALLPETGGALWHLAIRAPVTVKPATMSLPPSMVIVANEMFLLWCLNEPVNPTVARALSARLARQVGGKAATGEPVPLPGTVLFCATGTRLLGRFPVQMLPPLAFAYRLVDGQLAPPAGAKTISTAPLTKRADSIEVRPMRWLWPGYIPSGTLTLLGGAAGMGKSTVAAYVAATVSSGKAWPDGQQAEEGGVLLFEEEDDEESVVTPRLLAAKAKLRRIAVGRGVDLSNGIDALVAEAKRLGRVRLVVLSPLRKMFGNAEHLGNNGVRRALEPLLNWIEVENIALLGIMHPPADKEYQAAFAGSKAFFERARAAFSVIPDPSDKSPIMKHRRRIMVAAKSNHAPDGEVMGYRLETAHIQNIETSRVVWMPQQCTLPARKKRTGKEGDAE